MIRFLKEFDDAMPSLFGIRRNHVRLAIESADSVEIIEMPGPEEDRWHLYLKRVDQRNPPICLLVVANEEGDGVAVEYAWPIPIDMVPEDATPLEALRILCERFGCQVTAGEKTGTLIVSETIPLGGSDPRNAVSVERGDAQKGLGTFSFMVRSDPRVVEIGLVYALDVDRLAAAV